MVLYSGEDCSCKRNGSPNKKNWFSRNCSRPHSIRNEWASSNLCHVYRLRSKLISLNENWWESKTWIILNRPPLNTPSNLAYNIYAPTFQQFLFNFDQSILVCDKLKPSRDGNSVIENWSVGLHVLGPNWGSPLNWARRKLLTFKTLSCRWERDSYFSENLHVGCAGWSNDIVNWA